MVTQSKSLLMQTVLVDNEISRIFSGGRFGVCRIISDSTPSFPGWPHSYTGTLRSIRIAFWLFKFRYLSTSPLTSRIYSNLTSSRSRANSAPSPNLFKPSSHHCVFQNQHMICHSVSLVLNSRYLVEYPTFHLLLSTQPVLNNPPTLLRASSSPSILSNHLHITFPLERLFLKHRVL